MMVRPSFRNAWRQKSPVHNFSQLFFHPPSFLELFWITMGLQKRILLVTTITSTTAGFSAGRMPSCDWSNQQQQSTEGKGVFFY